MKLACDEYYDNKKNAFLLQCNSQYSIELTTETLLVQHSIMHFLRVPAMVFLGNPFSTYLRTEKPNKL